MKNTVFEILVFLLIIALGVDIYIILPIANSIELFAKFFSIGVCLVLVYLYRTKQNRQ